MKSKWEKILVKAMLHATTAFGIICCSIIHVIFNIHLFLLLMFWAAIMGALAFFGIIPLIITGFSAYAGNYHGIWYIVPGCLILLSIGVCVFLKSGPFFDWLDEKMDAAEEHSANVGCYALRQVSTFWNN